MAEVVKTLRAAGGDYSALSTWNATEATNLVSAGDTHKLICYGDWPSGLPDKMSMTGWTTDATHFVTIEAEENSETLGVADRVGAFRVYDNNVSSYVLEIKTAYTVLRGFQVKNSGTGANTSTKCIEIEANHVFLDKMIVWVDNGSNGAHNGAFRVYNNTGVRVWRSLFINSQGGISGCVYDSATDGAPYIEYRNVTMIVPASADSGSFGINQNSSRATSAGTSFNTAIRGRAYPQWYDGARAGPLDYAGSNNAAEDSPLSAPGTSPVLIADSDFVDFANGNYSIDETSAMYDAGVDQSSFFTADIANIPITTWCIGCYTVGSAEKTIQFDGPNVPDQTGDENQLFPNLTPSVGTRFSGTATPFSYALAPDSGPLPAGLSINATTGNIEGTATESGTFANVKVRGTGTP